MSINTFDQWIAGAKQNIPSYRTTTRTSVANRFFTVRDLAGNPGAGTLSAGNTANGLVPTDATAGFPPINFSTGAGYLSHVHFSNSVASRLCLYDRLFHAGPYNFNDNITLASQPSYAGRVPNANYAGLQLWVEFVTASTGTQSVAVTYTNQSGVTGHTTGTVVTIAGTIGARFQLPLASGDTGIQKIESVVGSVASAGTFNLVVLRQLWGPARVITVNWGDTHGPDRTGMPQVYTDSAIELAVNADSTSTGTPDIMMGIVSG